jgi:hypothetical protein
VTGNDGATQNVDLQVSTLNGGPSAEEIENKRITSVEEQTHSADVSVSGGSDTDVSRADASRPKLDKGNGKASSAVKKPTTFKSVSVNKSFLASKGGPSTAPTKPGDKSPATPGTPGVQLTASSLTLNRPRLIAKTGSGSRDSVPRLAANGGKPATAPDPSTVWNKNRRKFISTVHGAV